MRQACGECQLLWRATGARGPTSILVLRLPSSLTGPVEAVARKEADSAMPGRGRAVWGGRRMERSAGGRTVQVPHSGNGGGQLKLVFGCSLDRIPIRRDALELAQRRHGRHRRPEQRDSVARNVHLQKPCGQKRFAVDGAQLRKPVAAQQQHLEGLQLLKAMQLGDAIIAGVERPATV